MHVHHRTGGVHNTHRCAQHHIPRVEHRLCERTRHRRGRRGQRCAPHSGWGLAAAHGRWLGGVSRQLPPLHVVCLSLVWTHEHSFRHACSWLAHTPRYTLITRVLPPQNTALPEYSLADAHFQAVYTMRFSPTGTRFVVGGGQLLVPFLTHASIYTLLTVSHRVAAV